MLSQEQIVQLVRDKIISEVNPGDHAGSSGHLGNRQLEITWIHASRLETSWKAEGEYIVTTETEFTIYPDNPPYEEHYKIQMILNDSGDILNETKYKIKSLGGFDIGGWIDSNLE